VKIVVDIGTEYGTTSLTSNPWIGDTEMETNKKELPAHLQAIADKIDADHKRFGLTPMNEILARKSEFDDFHPIHAIIG